MFAQATATEIAQYMGNCHFLSISLSSILCKWSGEAEKNISRIFKDARWKSPSLSAFF